MRGSYLSNPEVVRLLKPFVVTSWHGADPAQMPPEVRNVYTASDLPKNTNVTMFVLDQQGRVVHSFHGLQNPRSTGSSYAQEIGKARALLKLPDPPPTADQKLDLRLPDLAPTGSGLPAGLRLFLRRNQQGAGKQLVVEVVAMKPEEWKVLAFSEKAKPIEPAALKNWLVQMYPPAIRTADQQKPFSRINGSLILEPAGSDPNGRYALLRGEVILSKGDDNESAFQGTLRAVLTYRSHAADVVSVQGIVEGDYLYRIRGTQAIPLRAAIESRPAARFENSK